MPITPHKSRWMVTVNDAGALHGYKRIRVIRETQAEAQQTLDAITEALKVYGKWPINRKDVPIKRLIVTREGAGGGTLRMAADLALKTHWKGMAYFKVTDQSVWNIVAWFEKMGVKDIDDIKSSHIDSFVDFCSVEAFGGNGVSPSTSNKYMSMLAVINQVALDRVPPLASKKIPLKYRKNIKVEQWWLKPEDHKKLTQHLRLGGNMLFADFIDMICYQGFRVQECLRLMQRHFIGLDTDTPKVQVPGTKTMKSQTTIPVFEISIELVNRCIERANNNGWKTLFPFTERQARDWWNDCRDYLSVRDVESATMRSLRRTFAAYADMRGMSTKTLQDILRHETITTTERYLQVTGGERTEQARKFMTIEKVEEPRANPLKEAIEAYKLSGATPEEMARFIKEMMQ